MRKARSGGWYRWPHSSARKRLMGCTSAAMTSFDDFLDVRPYTRDEVFDSPCPIDRVAGAYGWWFRTIPGPIDTRGCEERDGLTLLYVGISPSRPPTNGRPPSRQTIYDRIRYHYSGNAEGSTLRKTLGVLLASDLGVELRRVGSGKRRTFLVAGEAKLSDWMAENALVSWVPHREPWFLEEELIASLDLPLNLQGNSRNRFHSELSRLRAAAEKAAQGLPIGDGGGDQLQEEDDEDRGASDEDMEK